MSEGILTLLGLMRRAQALAVGEENTGETVRAGKARLLLLASDASDNAKKRAQSFAAGRRVITVPLPFSKEALSEALGLGGCSMAAVTDIGFADKLMGELAREHPEAYGPAALEIARRKQRLYQRKSAATAGKKRIGKRRKDG